VIFFSLATVHRRAKMASGSNRSGGLPELRESSPRTQPAAAGCTAIPPCGEPPRRPCWRHHPRAFLTDPWIRAYGPAGGARSSAGATLVVLTDFRRPEEEAPCPGQDRCCVLRRTTRALRQSAPERPTDRSTDSEAIVREAELSAG